MKMILLNWKPKPTTTTSPHEYHYVVNFTPSVINKQRKQAVTCALLSWITYFYAIGAPFAFTLTEP
jgi:hypothetical protein